MDNTDSNSGQTTAGTETGQTPADTVIMRTPRSSVWVWFLTFSTFGLYANFWFYARARELKKVTSYNLTPVLWFLMPFVAICQIFAFKKLDTVLLEIEDNESPKNQRKWYLIGSSLFFLSYIYLSFTSQHTVTGWVDLLVFVLLASSFTLMTGRANHAIRGLDNVEFQSRTKGNSVAVWLAVILLFPLAAGTLGYYAFSPLFANRLANFPEGSYYGPQYDNFRFNFRGGEWYRVETGSYSDGSALAEFNNEMPESYLLVFKGDSMADTSVNDHISGRREWIKENISDVDCREERDFVPLSMDLKIELTCEGKMVFEPAFMFVTFVQDSNHTYELIGFLSGTGEPYKRWHRAYKDMAGEFSTK